MNDYAVAFYGWFLFNLIYLGLAKDDIDKKHKPFNFKVWWKYSWDNVAITFIAIPAVVYFNPILWQWIINDWLDLDMKYDRAALMLAVPFVQGIYFVIRKFAR